MKASLRKQNIDYLRTHDLSMLLELFPQERVSEDDEFFVQVLSQSQWKQDTESVLNRRGTAAKCWRRQRNL